MHELTVLAGIAQAQFITAEATLNDHPLSPKAHLRIHTLHQVMQTLAALITMFASVGLSNRSPKPRRARLTPPPIRQVPATRRPATHAARAGAAPNPNALHRARPTAPHRLTRPGAPPRPPQAAHIH